MATQNLLLAGQEADTGNAATEWWMAAPPEGLDEQEGEEDEERERARPPMKLCETWCGGEFEPDTDVKTSCCSLGLFSPVRRYVAGGRHRYIWHGFDLDLTYITSRVIAMSFPGMGVENAFRNPYSEVKRFLDTRHRSRYRIYNLCCEKSRVDNGFDPPTTLRIPCVDHCPPAFGAIDAFCKDVKDWFDAHKDNVAVVHCKAGKGRTGTMICALLCEAKAVSSAYQALTWYEYTRGGMRSGVTIPAQIRWIAMYERHLCKGSTGLSSDPLLKPGTQYQVRSLKIGPLHLPEGGSDKQSKGCVPTVISLSIGLSTRDEASRDQVGWWYPEIRRELDASSCMEAELLGGPIWEESEGMLSLRITGSRQAVAKKKLKAWWHHAFLQQDLQAGTAVLDISKVWVDGLHRDMVKHKLVPEEFRLRVVFAEVKRVRTE